MATLGELIGIAREIKGLTLQDLDKMSGVSAATICRIESGIVRDPGFTTVIRLVDALGISLDRAATTERNTRRSRSRHCGREADVMRNERELTAFGPLSLGGLIDKLSACSPESGVKYDFCSMGPTSLKSYRGFYDHLAMGWSEGSSLTVKEVLAECRSAVGTTYEGYKGGDFTMDRDTPVWVSNYGECDSTGIVGVLYDDWRVILLTEFIP